MRLSVPRTLIPVLGLAAGIAAAAPVPAELSGGGEVAGRSVPLPEAFPIPAVPRSNPYSAAKAELGRYLFYDERLSVNGSFACASCHQQALAFTDGRTTAIGATGESHRRNTMSLANVLYNASFNWADPETASLEEQALVPMFGADPIEMGISGREDSILRELASDPRYQWMFATAFPADDSPVTMDNVVRAIASFERSLISANSPFDRFVRHGDEDALSTSAQRGLHLFFSTRLACSQCHRGVNLAGNSRWFDSAPIPLQFHNTGLYNLRRSTYPVSDRGLWELTGRRRDMGRFRAPTLRNIEVTDPYMHDGSIPTLEEVLTHYSVGGRTVHEGPNRGIGRHSRHKSRLIRPLALTQREIEDLLAFLLSLTDRSFLGDLRFADPLLIHAAGPSP